MERMAITAPTSGWGPAQSRTLDERVAEELRAEVARQGRSRRWLAAQVELSHTTVARWLRPTDPAAPTLDELDALCRALGLTVGQLLYTVQRTGGYRARPVAAAVG